jgi:branched-chain amino acid aminotransferase
MLVFLNGKFLAEEEAVVSVFDRSFLYGDGLFETLRVYGGRPFCWPEHIQRLQRGARFLKLEIPFGPEELLKSVLHLVRQNEMPEALLRISLSRGVGPRGYSPKGATEPVIVMSMHPAPQIDLKSPPRWRLATTSMRLPSQAPIAQFKTSNKLPQILARAEAESRDADEGLLLNTDGGVAEAASSNLFWIDHDFVGTPPLASGILPGVTRAVVLDICQCLGVAARESRILPKALLRIEGVFLSSSSLGVIEAVSLDGHPLRQSPLVGKIRAGYQGRVANLRAGGRV